MFGHKMCVISRNYFCYCCYDYYIYRYFLLYHVPEIPLVLEERALNPTHIAPGFVKFVYS